MKVKNILLVDDNDIDLYITKHILSKLKIAENITEKSSAIEALQYLKELAVDFPEIIFLDIRMPVMDGFAFLEHYSAFEEQKKKSCKIVMLTSSSDTIDIERANQNPYVIKYLNKPLEETFLSDSLFSNKI